MDDEGVSSSSSGESVSGGDLYAVTVVGDDHGSTEQVLLPRNAVGSDMTSLSVSDKIKKYSRYLMLSANISM